ncbi:putative alpha/beta hydrolase [Nocardia colli]|uniref:putative alpha/beta hydrolase n=1 Tax=Nocardia colli TaxID=2545717 RepID=UPI0035D63F13
MNTPRLVVLSVSELTAAAGGDPWQLQDQLLAGKPARILVLAEAFHGSGTHADAADRAFDQACRHFQGAYTGDDGSNVIGDSLIVNDAKAKLHGSSAALGKIGTDLAEIATALADAQGKTQPPIDALNRSLTDLESEFLRISWPARRFDEIFGVFGFQEMENAAVAVVAATHRQMTGIVTDYDQQLGKRLTDLDAIGYVPPVQLDDGIPDTDPAAVYKWWKSLTPVEQQAMIARRPEVIGNLDGIPVIDRSTANKLVMNADIRRVEEVANAMGVSVAAIRNDPAKYGLTTDDITRYHNASNVRAGLDGYRGADNADTYLYMYQPLAFGGKGRAAISIGNPDVAPNTAVLVPGASQSVRASDQSGKGWFVAQREQAQNLYDESNKADPNRPTAVLAWMGYDSPENGLTAVLRADPTAVRAGGDLLARDVAGLQATHQGTSHLTTVGHSAGAMVIADAGASGQLRADDAVVLGPVSTDEAHSAADFHLADRGHVYVGEVSNDLNAHGGHIYLGGPDSTDPEYGAIRIKAETPASYSGALYYSGAAHLHYFTAGSESLYATADITSGNGDQLAAHNMLATGDESTDGVRDDHFHGK